MFPLMACEAPLRVQDVFSSKTYSGTGVSNPIINGLRLLDFGGMLQTVGVSGGAGGCVYDSARGFGATGAVLPGASSAGLYTGTTLSFSNTGYTLAADTNGFLNKLGVGYIGWAFRRAAGFFDFQTVTKTAGSNTVVSFPNLPNLGMVLVKRTDALGSWFCWHRGLSAGKLVYLDKTSAEATLGQITVTGSTVSLINSVIADGSYVVYAWAHEPLGCIQCGSFTTDAAGNASVNHGWTAGVQFVRLKAKSTTADWEDYDTARTAGFLGNDARLRCPAGGGDVVARLSASGSTLSFTGLGASQSYLYLFIVAP